MSKEIYMVVDVNLLKVVQLGELNTITSKQMLENPEAVIYTAPISAGSSYSHFELEPLKAICVNEGIYEEGMAYVSMINVLRLHLKDRYFKEKDSYKAYGYYEQMLAQKRSENPEYWNQFYPTPPSDIPDSFKRGISSGRISCKAPNESAKPRSAGATGRVWEIADKVESDNPTKEGKELRALIINACVKSGINPATASTQYSKWKKSKEI